MTISRPYAVLGAASLLVAACFLLTPRAAHAQAATGNIAGTVKDSSGGTLPGVTVEASSPVLIEKTRSTVTELRVELCSECHPFYTGKQKLVDTGGRVERFNKRYAKKQS